MDLHEQMKYGEFPSYEQIRDGIMKLIDEGKISREDAALVVPELKENEDERIRKRIILRLQYDLEHNSTDFSRKEIPEEIAYLEKQKEQKPVKLNDDTEVGLDRALQIVKGAKGNLCGYQSDDGIYECDHAIQTLERILKNGIEQHAAEWSEEDEKIWKDIFELCDRFGYNDACRKLKSLRPQPHWKPSEEQMRALSQAVGTFASFAHLKADSKVLTSLHNDLNKL